MQSLRASELQALTPQLCHLLQEPFMVWCRPLEGSPRQKGDWITALGLHIQRGRMSDLPELRSPRGTFHDLPHGRTAQSSLFSTDIRPDGQVEHELRELVLPGIVGNRPQGLRQEIPLEALSAGRLVHVCITFVHDLVVVTCVLRWPTLLAAHVCQARHGFAELRMPVQVRPQRALHGFLFDEAQGPLASLCIAAGVLFKKTTVPLHVVLIAGVSTAHEECEGLSKRCTGTATWVD